LANAFLRFRPSVLVRRRLNFWYLGAPDPQQLDYTLGRNPSPEKANV